ncbi:putative mRNA export factor MEX67 [Tricladium varicosporioides]|nr:putative mRNA export factor MEX67 [Hymenoscyphus varicosporioides]
MKRSSPAPRGPRNSSPSVRGGGRGGIQKRRAAGPVRVDKDGDLVMDPAAAGEKRRSGRGGLDGRVTVRGAGRDRGGSSRGGISGTLKTQQAIIKGMNAKQANVLEARVSHPGTQLRIDGLAASKAASNPDGGLESLLAFLERKASGHDTASNRSVKIKKSLRQGGSVIITASPEDITEIQKLNNFTFAGAPLKIEAYTSPAPTRGEKKDGGPSPSAQETKEKLKAVLASRYDVELKLLNLSALAQDAGLREMGVFDGSTTTSKIFPALMVVCGGLFKSRQEKRDAIVSVTLADNELADVTDVAALAETFPDLKNLDLSRNKISQLSNLNAWGSKMRNLSTLLLTGNPIESQLATLKDDIMKRYPFLEVLNGVQVRTAEEVAAALEIAKCPIPLAAPDFRDVGQVGENFIRQFIALYDTNRPGFAATFYDTQSIFSLSCNMNAPTKKVPGNAGKIPPWAPYVKLSRNLVRINNLPTQMSRAHRGQQAILTLWSTLPVTKHPDLETQADKYLIECHPLPGLVDPTAQSARGVDGLIVTIHGEFAEQQADSPEPGIRSFSRTFVLGPGGPGGPPIRVISDMLSLRAYGPLAQPSNNQQTVAAVTNPEQQRQEAITMQLVEKTGMTPNYAILCLTETQWDLEKAFVVFNANKVNQNHILIKI